MLRKDGLRKSLIFYKEAVSRYPQFNHWDVSYPRSALIDQIRLINGEELLWNLGISRSALMVRLRMQPQRLKVSLEGAPEAANPQPQPSLERIVFFLVGLELFHIPSGALIHQHPHGLPSEKNSSPLRPSTGS